MRTFAETRDRNKYLPKMSTSALDKQVGDCADNGAKLRLRLFYEEYCPLPSNGCPYQTKERTFVKTTADGTSYFGCQYSKMNKK